jgi:LCP family protein required for cell wall assembly
VTAALAIVAFLVGAALGVGGERAFHRVSGEAERHGDAPLDPRRRRRRRRWVTAVAVAVVLVIVAIPVAFVFWANHQFSKIPRVQVSSHLGGDGSGTNYLLVGSDNRPGVSEDLADTILLIHADSHGTKMLSIPRDLWVTIAGTGQHAKINAAYAGRNPGRLVDTVRQSLGIHVTRYLEVNFVAFPAVVDAIGGITIDFPHPAFDTHSGLNIPNAGPNHLNGQQALAYVRSRYYNQVIDGKAVPDGLGDLARVQRQQTFLRAVFKKLSDSKNPFTLMRAASAMAKGVHIDDTMSLIDAFEFAWRMRNIDPNTVTLPTDFATRSGQSVLLLGGGAGAVLNQFK